MVCPAANIHCFLIKKGCDEDDVNRMLAKCFSPDELAKIGYVLYNGPLAVLKGIDMTEMVKTLRKFDMDRRLSKEEKTSRAQQATASRTQYGVATHGVQSPSTLKLAMMMPKLRQRTRRLATEPPTLSVGRPLLKMSLALQVTRLFQAARWRRTRQTALHFQCTLLPRITTWILKV